MINFVAHQLLDRTEISELHVMIAALQDHIVLTKKLNLHFVAQLLTMALVEVKSSIHNISIDELDAFGRHLEGR